MGARAVELALGVKNDNRTTGLRWSADEFAPSPWVPTGIIMLLYLDRSWRERKPHDARGGPRSDRARRGQAHPSQDDEGGDHPAHPAAAARDVWDRRGRDEADRCAMVGACSPRRC